MGPRVAEGQQPVGPTAPPLQDLPGFPAGGFDRIDVPKGMFGPVGEDEINKGSLATERPSILGAAFRTENIVGSYLSSEAKSVTNDMDPAFRPWDSVKGTKYEKHWSRLSGVFNPTRMAAVLKDIDREEEDKAALAASPILGTLASAAASIADVTTALPGGALAGGVRGGLAIGKSALSIGAAAAAGTAVQEAGLQATQQTRTPGESAVAIGGSAVLGGLLGAGAAHVLTKMDWARQSTQIDRVMGEAGGAEGRLREFEAGAREAANTDKPFADAGAAVTPRPEIGDLEIYGKGARAVGTASAWLNPSLRLGSSPSAEVRSVGERLLKNSVYLNMHDDGRTLGVAAETAMIEHMGAYARSVQAMGDIYAEARKAGLSLTTEEFQRVVGRALRRNDTADIADPQLWQPVKRLADETDGAFQDRISAAIEPVTKAAAAWRATLFDPLKEQAIKQGLLPADVSVETAATYFSRQWRREQIVAQEGVVKSRFREYFTGAIDEAVKAFDGATGRRLAAFDAERRDLEMTKLRRQEELRAREQDGGEVSADTVSEGDIRSAIRLVQGGGGPRPKGVETLTQFIVKAGGLVEDQGELAYRGIVNSLRPGLLRKEARRGTGNGGWTLDDMARHAWEKGYFPEHTDRPSIDEFLDALTDDVHRHRPVLRANDREAFRLQEIVRHLEEDLSRMGINPASPRFSTSEELKGVVSRVAQALDAEADQRIAALEAKIAEVERDTRLARLERFGDPDGRDFSLAVDDATDNVFSTLTGRTVDRAAPGYKIVAARRGPLAERTFNIPDRLVEDFLEDNVSEVGKRYARVMGADVELARNFQGDPTLKKAIDAIREDYDRLRRGVTDEAVLRSLDKRQKHDIGDLEALRDMLRGNITPSHAEQSFDRIVRVANMMNYVRLMGGVVTASLTDIVRVPMVHGMQALGVGPLAARLGSSLKKEAIRLSVQEAQLAGNVLEKVHNSRLASIIDVTDPYRTKSAAEAFMEKMTDVASRWNGIRTWTDTMKGWASVVTQNRILDGVGRYADLPDSERRYLAFLGIDRSMAERIAAEAGQHGTVTEGVRVAGSASWADESARRAFYGAVNKDVDSIVIQQSRGDIPLFANTPLGRMALQFKSFTLASNQRILMRGLQEDQARFLSGTVGMVSIGMMIGVIKAYEANRQNELSNNPGYWISEGLDRSGILAIPFELSNTAEKLNLYGAKRAAVDIGEILFPGVSGKEGPSRFSSRGKMSALFGPTVGFAEDIATVLTIPEALATDGEVRDSQKTAAKNLLPFMSYTGVKQFLNYAVLPPD